MSISDETVQELKTIFKEEHDKDMTDSEAREAANNLAGYFDLLWKLSQKEAQREKRLKTEPDGFPVDGGYSCMVCGNGINETTGWYHWGGPRCLLCHKAIVDGIIPFFVLKYRDSYYSDWHLKDKFKIKSSQTIKKMVRDGELITRTIMNGDRIHEQIFLKKENPNLVERWNPMWKSEKRHRDKVSEKWSRNLKEKMMADFKKKHKAK